MSTAAQKKLSAHSAKKAATKQKAIAIVAPILFALWERNPELRKNKRHSARLILSKANTALERAKLPTYGDEKVLSQEIITQIMSAEKLGAS